MMSRLRQAGLWSSDGGEPEINIKFAWNLLSRLGFPARYSGRAQDGSYEYVIIDPKTGHYLATGKGFSLETSMCDAALNASQLIDRS